MNFTYKQIWFINFPVMMNLLVEQLINITDTIFLGRLGETELGASAIAGIYYLAIYMLGFGFSLGLQVMIARQNGKNKYENTGKVFFQGMFFLISIAIFLFLFSKFWSPFILQKLIYSKEVYNAVIKYIDWRSLGLLFAFPALAFRSFFVGILKTRILTVGAFVMLSTNILLNYFLIFGIGDFKGWGISGAAIASTLSEFVSLLIFISYLWLKVEKIYYKHQLVFNKKILIKLLRLSVWSMLHSFIGVAPWFLFFIAIEHLGKSQLAIANIIRSVSTLFFVIVNSFATTTSSLVSNLIGEKEERFVMPLCRKIILLSYFVGIPLIVLAFLFSNNILRIYTDNKTLIEGAFWPFIVMLFNYFFAVPGYIYCNTVIGIGNTKIAFIFQLITIIFYLTYLYLISTFTTASLAVYWTAEYLYVVLLLTFSLVYLKRRRWKKE